MISNAMFILFLVLFLLLPCQSFSDQLAGKYPLCSDREMFIELLNAIDKEDATALKWLRESGNCYVLPAGTKATVLDVKYGEFVRARVYYDGVSTIVWSFVEEVVPDT